MGGTSTDVSRYAGDMEHIFESTTAGVTVQVPQLDINTVAAGGGSILVWRNGMLAVGPESAGSHPGPACYRKGGPLTVTDANLVLGRILPDHFPKIFGPNENEPLDIEAPRKLFGEVTERINAAGYDRLTYFQGQAVLTKSFQFPCGRKRGDVQTYPHIDRSQRPRRSAA